MHTYKSRIAIYIILTIIKQFFSIILNLKIFNVIASFRRLYCCQILYNIKKRIFYNQQILRLTWHNILFYRNLNLTSMQMIIFIIIRFVITFKAY